MLSFDFAKTIYLRLGLIVIIAIAVMPSPLARPVTSLFVIIVAVADTIAPTRRLLLLIDLIGFLVDAIAIAINGGALGTVLYGALYSGAAIVIAHPSTQARMANIDLINHLNDLVIAAINSCRLCASLLSGSVGKSRKRQHANSRCS